jgi:phosphatidylglycerol lysyltransferase
LRRAWIRGVAPLVSLVALTLAAWVLNQELRGHTYTSLRQGVLAMTRPHVTMALALTALSYAVLTSYDRLALRYLQLKLPYRQSALASFLGFAFSRNLGPAVLGSAAPRYRLYASWDVPPLDIATLVGFTALTFWLGAPLIAGLALLLTPAALAPHAVAPGVLRALGALLTLLALLYPVVALVRRRPLQLRGYEIEIPPAQVAIAQLVLSVLDWSVTGAVLYVLLPHTVPVAFGPFLGLFVIAMVAGRASQVPSGLGVFECVLLVTLATAKTVPGLLGALLVFRVVYSLLPLIAAVMVLGAYESLVRRGPIGSIGTVLGRWIAQVAPRLLAVSTFLGGALLLATGNMPARQGRLGWLSLTLPLPAVELSHFLASLAGLGLVLLASALQNRLDAAYLLTVVLLAAGAALALLRGLHWEEATVLIGMLLVLLPCRRLFYRRAQVLGDLFSPGWLAAVAAVVGGSLWLGLFAFRHLEYSRELWWQFAFFSSAPRVLRASVGVLVLSIGFAVAHLLRPAPAVVEEPDAATLDRVRAVTTTSRSAIASVALLGDKSFLFSDSGKAFIMYAISGSCWVAMSDPVGPVEERTELVWRFRELCDHYDVHPVFYEVTPESLPLYLDVGLTPFKFGECARVALDRFTLEGPARKGTRYVLKRQERDGSTFEVVAAQGVAAIVDELRTVSDSWLAKRNTREKGFSLGSFSADYVCNFPVGVARRGGRIVAFTNLWCGAEKDEVAPDLMRYAGDAPSDSMEYLFTKVMLWAQAEGYRWFNLGMAPLAGLEAHALAPFWQRVGAFAYRHGEHFYNFQGVRHYKEQFDPEWQPRYLVAPGGLVLPRVLASVGALVSGGLKGLVSR